MGIRKVAIPLNKAKNKYLKWLKKKKAKTIAVFEGLDNDDSFNYYRSVTCVMSDDVYMVSFYLSNREERISLWINRTKVETYSINEFLELLEKWE